MQSSTRAQHAMFPYAVMFHTYIIHILVFFVTIPFRFSFVVVSPSFLRLPNICPDNTCLLSSVNSARHRQKGIWSKVLVLALPDAIQQESLAALRAFCIHQHSWTREGRRSLDNGSDMLNAKMIPTGSHVVRRWRLKDLDMPEEDLMGLYRG